LLRKQCRLTATRIGFAKAKHMALPNHRIRVAIWRSHPCCDLAKPKHRVAECIGSFGSAPPRCTAKRRGAEQAKSNQSEAWGFAHRFAVLCEADSIHPRSGPLLLLRVA
jgi:hypothetical protein